MKLHKLTIINETRNETTEEVCNIVEAREKLFDNNFQLETSHNAISEDYMKISMDNEKKEYWSANIKFIGQ